jgi:hypothetical protein
MQQPDTFENLIHEGHEYLTRCQQSLEEEYRINRWPSYDWSQNTGQLIFSEDNVRKVIASIEFVGSISTKTDTWLWAWGNDSLDQERTRLIRRVRTYGETHGIQPLVTASWHAHEADGWEMTSIAAYLLDAKGAYRTPQDNGFTFMILTNVQWAT